LCANVEEADLKVLSIAMNAPSSRIRIFQMAEYLKKYDIDVKVKTFPMSIKELTDILKKEEYELIWFQKKLPNIPMAFAFLRHSKAPIVFDFDDNILVKMMPKDGSYRSKGREFKFKLVKLLSSGFTCCSSFLKSKVDNSKKPCFIYPTPVPINVPKKDCNTLNHPLILGWVGLSGNFPYLDRVMSHFERLRRDVDFKLIILSDKDYPKKYDFIENVKWNLETQEQEISKFDIGIMPLNTESPYDKGKCSYKLLQYMASGVIPVGEAYGMNLDVIKDKVNGFLVYNNDWYGTLKKIIEGIKSGSINYCKLSKEAIRTVVDGYSYESLAPKLASFLREIALKRR